MNETKATNGAMTITWTTNVHGNILRVWHDPSKTHGPYCGGQYVSRERRDAEVAKLRGDMGWTIS